MSINQNGIAVAIHTIGLHGNVVTKLSDDAAAEVVNQTLSRFVAGPDRRWWWEAFVGKSVARYVRHGWKELTRVIPEPDALVWFIVEDDEPPLFPVYETTPSAAMRIIGECIGFEYYLVAKDMSWILCENHHDVLIAVGEPVASRLEQLPESPRPGTSRI